MSDVRAAPAPRSRSRVLVASIVVVATTGMLYEFALGTLASYFLGNAATQFAIVLGVYLSAMGAGAAVSARLGGQLTARFVEVETAVALVGGASAAALFYAFAHSAPVQPVLYATVFVLGLLVGVELPLLLRLLREDIGFEGAVVEGLTFDYVGSLLAAVLFPLLLVPLVGLVRTAALSGVVNAAVAWLGAGFVEGAAGKRARQAGAFLAGAALLVLFAYAGEIARATGD